MKRRPSFALLAGWLAFSAASAADVPPEPGGSAPPPKFTCTPEKPQDDCTVSTGRDGVVLSIASASGIGGARLDLTEGAAPRRLTLRFPKMANLESFTVSDGKIDLNGCSRVGNCSFDGKGRVVQDPKEAVYSLRIWQNKDKDRMEVEMTLPRGEPGTKEWRLSWIDAYRR